MPTHSTCSIDGCTSKHVARGFCRVHYNRWQRYGSPRGGGDYQPKGATAAERFWAKVDRSGGPDACWPWTGAKAAGGYGEVYRHRRAHRVSYELAVGPIPAGLIVCHSCDNPPCVSPKHLWLGTDADNMRDAASKGRVGGARSRGPIADNVAKTHCPQGHPYDAANTYMGKNGRACRACHRADERRRRRARACPVHSAAPDRGEA